MNVSIKPTLLAVASSKNPLREIEIKELIESNINSSKVMIDEDTKNKIIDTYFNYYLCCYGQIRSNRTRRRDILEKYFCFISKNSHNNVNDLTQVCKFVCKHDTIATDCIYCCSKYPEICPHIRNKDQCILCGGSSFCPHFITKRECMLCSASKRCKNKECNAVLSDYLNDVCMMCLVKSSKIPSKWPTRFKEHTIISLMLPHFIDLPWVFNKKISHSLHKRRPDAFVIMKEKVLIIEIDEYSHDRSSYVIDNDRRNKDMMEDLFYKDVAIIRFNPDSYVKNNTYHGSCFTEKEGEIVVADENRLNGRMNKLVSTIKKQLKKKTWDEFKIIKLFYGD